MVQSIPGILCALNFFVNVILILHRLILSFRKLWFLRGCIQKFSDWFDNEIYAYNKTRSLKSNAKGY